MNLFETTVLSGIDAPSESAVGKAVLARENVFVMTQAAEDAVLRPRDCGMFSHEMRAALAARVARLAREETLANRFLAGAGDQAALADPAETGEVQGMPTVLAFVDKVANQTRDVIADDVAGLQAAGVSDADIVRLCELVAFLAYQLRVASGLRLMQGGAR